MLPARQDTTSVLLHVDDNADDLVLLQAAIRMAAIPFRLRQFATVAAASAYLKGDGSFADRDLCPLPIAVLLDHNLTGFTGADALPEIRKLPGCSTLPLIIFSGSESPLNVRQSVPVLTVGARKEGLFLSIRKTSLRLSGVRSLTRFLIGGGPRQISGFPRNEARGRGPLHFSACWIRHSYRCPVRRPP